MMYVMYVYETGEYIAQFETREEAETRASETPGAYVLREDDYQEQYEEE